MPPGHLSDTVTIDHRNDGNSSISVHPINEEIIGTVTLSSVSTLFGQGIDSAEAAEIAMIRAGSGDQIKDIRMKGGTMKESVPTKVFLLFQGSLGPGTDLPMI